MFLYIDYYKYKQDSNKSHRLANRKGEKKTLKTKANNTVWMK